jgi:hypothetical protein
VKGDATSELLTGLFTFTPAIAGIASIARNEEKSEDF